MSLPFATRSAATADDPALETELATALALARASASAMLQLSPLAHREITAALTQEIGALEAQSDPTSQGAAQALKQYLSEAA